MATVNPSASTPSIWAGRQAPTGLKSTHHSLRGNAMRATAAPPSPTPPPTTPPASASPGAAPRAMGRGNVIAKAVANPLGAQTRAAQQPSVSSAGPAAANPAPPSPAAPMPPAAAPPRIQPPTGGTVPIQGDVDGDGLVNGADGKALLSYLFSGASLPGGLEAADLNGDGSIDIADAMQMFQSEVSTPAAGSGNAGSGTPLRARDEGPGIPLPVSFQQARATSGYAKTMGLLAVSQKI